MHILIVDDHIVFRRGLRDILADDLPTASFSEAGDVDQMLRLLANSQTELVVLDLNMPGRSGLDVLPDLKKAYPRLPVIILSVNSKDQYALPCRRAGASAYLQKDCAAEELAAVVKELLAVDRHVSPHQTETPFTAFV
jgi:DNA-binding NarL/FixJ family response regulator